MSGARDPIDQQFAALADLNHVNVEQHKEYPVTALDEKNVDEKNGGDISIVSSDQDHHVRQIAPNGEIWVHPTEDEQSGPNALRRIPDKVPWPAYLIGIVEMAERFSYYGSTAVFVNFIQRPLPPGSTTGAGKNSGHVSGALGLGTQASTGLTTFNSFWVYVIPLFGAYIADTRLGRFRTICYSVAIALVGHTLLIISAIPSVIVHPHSAVAVFAVSIIIMGLGTGGFKANISPLVAEQYKITAQRVETLKTGERVIVDPAKTAERIYLYFYMLINVGALVGQIGMAYSERYVGFWLAYTLPTVAFLLSPIVLYIGRNRYARSPPQGSVAAEALRVFRTAWKNANGIRDPAFWEKAKPSWIQANQANGSESSTRPSWLTYDDVFVDEVRRGLKACQVFIFFPFYWLSYNQLNNNLTSQAATMVTGSVPPDVINNLDPLALIVLIPICDRVIYPWLARRKIRFTPIKKIFWGFMTGVMSMIWAAVVQHYIYKRSACGTGANTCATPAPISVWVQSGAYILIAISEIFASITGLEYAFTKAPKNMRSLVMSVFLFQSALSSAIGEGLNPLSSDPLLIWNYAISGIICFVAGVLFWICFRHLDKEEDALNEIGNMRADAIGAPADEKNM